MRRFMKAASRMLPTKTEYMSPQEYLDLVNSSLADEIDTSYYIPGQIGSGKFGSFKITYKNPILREQVN